MRKQLIGVFTLVALLFLWVPDAKMATSDYLISIKIDKTVVMISATNAKFASGDTVSVDLYNGNGDWLLNRTTTVQVKGKADFARLNFAALNLPAGSYKVRVAKGVEISDDYADKVFAYGANTSPTPTPIKLTGLKIVSKTNRFKVNQVATLQVKAVPDRAPVGHVHWFSSDEAIATVDTYSGVLTAKAPGTIYVIVTNDEGTLVDGMSMLVYVPVSNITINKSKVTIRRNKSTTLVLRVSPSRATLPQMEWKSSDEKSKNKVLKWTSVGNGVLKITGVSPGKVTLTAQSISGKFKVTCKVTVKK